jgi:hypothetical protein
MINRYTTAQARKTGKKFFSFSWAAKTQKRERERRKREKKSKKDLEDGPMARCGRVAL